MLMVADGRSRKLPPAAVALTPESPDEIRAAVDDLIARLVECSRKARDPDRVGAALENIARKAHRFDARRGRIDAYLRTLTWQSRHYERRRMKGAGVGPANPELESMSLEVLVGIRSNIAHSRMTSPARQDHGHLAASSPDPGFTDVDLSASPALALLAQHCQTPAELRMLWVLYDAGGSCRRAAAQLTAWGHPVSKWTVQRFVLRLRNRIPPELRRAMR